MKDHELENEITDNDFLQYLIDQSSEIAEAEAEARYEEEQADFEMMSAEQAEQDREDADW